MFKFVVLCGLVAAASAVSRFSGSNYGQNAYSGHAARSGPTSDDVHAEVNHYSSDVRADGFQYAFDTTNGIRAAASGDAYGNIQGDFGWTSPEGLPVAVQYVADENGYQPHSDVLPTPPPVPEAILRSLEYIRTHPQYVEPARNFVQHPARNFAHNTGKNFGRHF